MVGDINNYIKTLPLFPFVVKFYELLTRHHPFFLRERPFQCLSVWWHSWTGVNINFLCFFKSISNYLYTPIKRLSSSVWGSILWDALSSYTSPTTRRLGRNFTKSPIQTLFGTVSPPAEVLNLLEILITNLKNLVTKDERYLSPVVVSYFILPVSFNCDYFFRSSPVEKSHLCKWFFCTNIKNF